MHPILLRPFELQDFQNLEHHDTPYRFEAIFRDRGWLSRRRDERRYELLRGIDEELRHSLFRGEEVCFVTWGFDASVRESWLAGWTISRLNRRAIVVTDRRVLLLHIQSGWRPGPLRAQLAHSAIEEVGRSALGHARLKLSNGHTLLLAGIPVGDRSFLRELVDGMKGAGMELSPAARGREDLCPHCSAVVVGRPEHCQSCGGRFKSPRRAGFLSFLFPGLGEWYLGHRRLAYFEMGGVGLLWTALFLPGGGPPMSSATVVILALAILVFIHGSDAFGTWYLAQRSVYPDGR